MGYIAHHCIVVTTWKQEHLETARDKAIRIFGDRYVTPILTTEVNQYYTFFIGPDGSKEGWATSTEGDDNRSDFLTWARDVNLYLDILEVRYGGDEPEKAAITANIFYEEGMG